MLRNAGRPRLAPLRWLRTRKVEASQKPSLVYLDPHNTSRRSEDSTESFGSSDCGGTEEHRAAACLQRAFRGFRARKQAQTGPSTVPHERAQIKAVYRPVMTAQALVAAADCALEARSAQQPASFYKAHEPASFYKERMTSAVTHGTREEDDETLVKKAIRLLRAAASRCLAPTHFDNDDYDDAAPLSAWARGQVPLAHPRHPYAAPGKSFASYTQLSAIRELPEIEPDPVYICWKEQMMVNGMLVKVMDDAHVEGSPLHLSCWSKSSKFGFRSKCVGTTLLEQSVQDGRSILGSSTSGMLSAVLDLQLHGMAMQAAATFHDANLFASLSGTVQWLATLRGQNSLVCGGRKSARSFKGMVTGVVKHGIFHISQTDDGWMALDTHPGGDDEACERAFNPADLAILQGYTAAMAAADAEPLVWGGEAAALYRQLARQYVISMRFGVDAHADTPSGAASSSHWNLANGDLRGLQLAAALDTTERGPWQAAVADAVVRLEQILYANRFTAEHTEPQAIAKIPAEAYSCDADGRFHPRESSCGAGTALFLLQLASYLRANGGCPSKGLRHEWAPRVSSLAQSLADILASAFMSQHTSGCGFGGTVDIYSLQSTQDSFSLTTAYSPVLLLPLLALLECGAIRDTYSAAAVIKAIGAVRSATYNEPEGRSGYLATAMTFVEPAALSTPAVPSKTIGPSFPEWAFLSSFPWLSSATLLRARASCLALLGYAGTAEVRDRTALPYVDRL